MSAGTSGKPKRQAAAVAMQHGIVNLRCIPYEVQYCTPYGIVEHRDNELGWDPAREGH